MRARVPFETLLRRHDLTDPALWQIAAVVHDADLETTVTTLRRPPGLNVVLRGLSMTHDDEEGLADQPIFGGLLCIMSLPATRAVNSRPGHTGRCRVDAQSFAISMIASPCCPGIARGNGVSMVHDPTT